MWFDWNEIFSAILSGIVSGFVVAVLFSVFGQYWITKIVPWYEEKVYQGSKIDGEWELIDESAPDNPWRQTEKLTISQSAHRLSGEGMYLPKQEGEAKIYNEVFIK